MLEVNVCFASTVHCVYKYSEVLVLTIQEELERNNKNIMKIREAERKRGKRRQVIVLKLEL